MRRIAGFSLVLLLLTSCSSSPGSHTTTFQAVTPVGLAIAGGRVWTVNAGGADVAGRTDPTSTPIRASVGDAPLRAAFDGHWLWVTVFGAGKVVALDPSTARIVHQVPLPGQPEGIVAAFGAIWVVRQEAQLLTRISGDGTVGPSFHLGQEPRLVAASTNTLLVSNFLDGTVTAVDPQSGTTRTSDFICAGAQDLLVNAGVLWVSCTPTGLVEAVNLNTLRALGQVKVGGEPDALRMDGSKLYVVTTTGPTLVAIDPNPQHPTIVKQTKLGNAEPLQDQANVDAVVMNGTWWISSPKQNKVIVYSP